jgi:glycosyltransferase involved in cell wall biosynthesis
MSLTFSVITPSYNQGRFIERTIQSVLAQTEVELDYLVCDGGSTDTTLDVLRRYEGQLRWVSGPDGGQAAAVNNGISATTGNIIAWLNSDDVYYPQALAQVQHIFATHPEVDIIYGDAHHIDELDQIIEPYPTAKWNYRILKDVCFICQPATFFRRSLVDHYGPLNAQLKFCMDYELWLRYGRHTEFFYLPQVLAGSRLYQDTKTLGQRVAVHREINDMMVQTFGISPEKWVLAYASVVVEDHDTQAGRDLASVEVQARRMNEFFGEVLRSYGCWRNGMMSLGTAVKLMRWVGATYYRWLKSHVVLKLQQLKP